MMGESKWSVLQLLPPTSYPETYLIHPDTQEDYRELAQRLGFPLIVKPDIGERGLGVACVRHMEELQAYINRYHLPFLMQKFVRLPLELGVFYFKYPGRSAGVISSIVAKKFLTVKGDGKKSVGQLIQEDIRGALQVKPKSGRIPKDLWQSIPAKNKTILVEPIGNHSRGTKFLDYTRYAPKLQPFFDELAADIDGFYFGRFDIKCASINALARGEDYKILELNGAGAEPAHIYQPGFSLREAYQVILWHLHVLADISRLNWQRGIPYWSFARGWKKFWAAKASNRRLNRL